jgi:hypothetical protein
MFKHPFHCRNGSDPYFNAFCPFYIFGNCLTAITVWAQRGTVIRCFFTPHFELHMSAQNITVNGPSFFIHARQSDVSTHPLLIHLEEAGAGIEVDGELILGTAWSDDLMMLVEEDDARNRKIPRPLSEPVRRVKIP